MKVLVTGAAGYIGSIVTERLVNHGHQVIASDNLQSGHRQSIHPQAIFEQGDLLDAEWLKHLFKRHPLDAVFHLAADSVIDPSIKDPGKFFRSNVSGEINLLDALAGAGVKRLIISSTAAVYGEPQRPPITEDHPLIPVNAEGESKLALERMLGWYRRAYGINYIASLFQRLRGNPALQRIPCAGDSHYSGIVRDSDAATRSIPTFRHRLRCPMPHASETMCMSPTSPTRI